MAVLKHRPRIALVAPRVVPLGREVELLAILESRAPVPVRSVQIDLAGRALWISEGEHGPEASASDFYRSGARLHEEGELAAGRLELPARVTLPATLPGSYRGQRIRVEYSATVKVDIPWWPDAVESFQIQTVAAGTLTRPRPVIAYSTSDGRDAGAPHVELSLVSTELVPGAILEAAASFGNVARNRYRRLELDLVAVETSDRFLHRGSSLHRAARWVSELDGVCDDEPCRMRLRLPDDLVPAFAVADLSIVWMLRARVRIARGRDPVLEIPVTIHPIAGPESAVRAPPEVGSGRIAELWRQVGAESGLVPDGAGGLTGAVGGARLRVGRELSGRRGPALVAEIDMPDLRIGLSLEGRRRTPRARDPRQADILTLRLGDLLARASAVSATDRAIRCATRGIGARSSPLAAFIGAAVALARALETVRRELPPPAAFDGDIEEWRLAAGGLGARLEPGGPALVGDQGGLPFAVAPVWTEDGSPVDLEVTVGAPAPIDRRHHLHWQEWDPHPADEGIARLCERARSFEIDRVQVRARLPRADGLDRAASLVAELAALARTLSGPPAAGAYR